MSLTTPVVECRIRVLIVGPPGTRGPLPTAPGDDQRYRYDVSSVRTADEAVIALATSDLDVVLLEVVDDAASEGLAALARLRSRHPRVPVVVALSSDDGTVAAAALEAGAQDVVLLGESRTARACRLAVHRQTITDRLEDAGRRARAESVARGRFLADMSHELRAPLAAVIGYAGLLRDPSLPPETRAEYAGIVHAAGSHLLSLVNEVLDLSSLEAREPSVSPGPVTLRSLVKEVADLFRLGASEKGLRLHVTADPSVPDRFSTDERHLRQILVNLVGNAVKFTTRGGVSVAASARVDGGRRTCVFKVSDTGVGIPAALRGRVFERFFVSDTPVSRTAGGTGLGLAITSRLVKALGGDLLAEAGETCGSVFTVELPESGDTADAGTTTVRAPDPAPLLGRTVLVADDMEHTRKLVALYLRRAGAEVVTAGDGAEALRAFRPGSFDAVVLDMQMPVVSGYRTAGYLRRADPTVPVIALTATATREDELRCLLGGCSAYLIKPVDPADLVSSVADGIAARAARVDQTGHAAAPRVPFSGALPPVDDGIDDLREDYVRGLAGHAEDLRRMSREGDLEGLQRLTHQLAGSAGSYGLHDVTPVARRADAALRRAPSAADAAPEVVALVERLSSVGNDANVRRPAPGPDAAARGPGDN